ncbi:MAG: NAD(P)H-hydrate dehydratase [Candidatus Omnitrophota bacterium]
MRSLSNRRSNTHKGDYGHVFVLAGSAGFTGAAYLCSQAALLTGSGLVTLGLPKGLNTILARKLTEVMTRPLPQTRGQSLSLKAFCGIKEFSRKADVIAIGPGLSQNRSTQSLVRKVVSLIDRPMVIDADGLNAIAGHASILKTSGKMAAPKIITPHPGEMARLIGRDTKYVQENRKKVAKNFASRYNIITVLKGHRTIIADPKGNTYINRTGNPGMASGGVGDVLTGMIASLLGQGLKAFEAARTGVYLHGLAGDIAAKKKGQASLIASDLLDMLPRAIRMR